MKNLTTLIIATLTLWGFAACHSGNVAEQSGEAALAERLSPEEAFQKVWKYAEKTDDDQYTLGLTESEARKLGISAENYAQALAWLRNINTMQKALKHTDFVDEQYILLLTEEKARSLGISGEEYAQVTENIAKMNVNIRRHKKFFELNAKLPSTTVKSLASLANRHETPVEPPYAAWRTREDIKRWQANAK
ncbi:MAG: hypothetical protein LBB79_00790 [Prevotellaceae bacterium]|jgi:hypothetical protein|nr:hypothetical protein [Prevotellaceae bacterium]